MRQCALEDEDVKLWRTPKGEVQHHEARRPAEIIYFKPSPSRALEDDFNALAGRWESETAHLSSVHDAVMHQNYQRIIGMGRAALPLILRRLQRRPSHWFWALRAITGENPVPPELAGNIAAMADRWLSWGRQNGLID